MTNLQKGLVLAGAQLALVARPANHSTGLHVNQRAINPGAQATVLMEPVAFFLPEHAMVPSVRSAGEELWIEVTVPKTGPPRPIKLAIKRGDSFTPLGLK
jgi:FAD/FMN-containing dehydrogenase